MDLLQNVSWSYVYNSIKLTSQFNITWLSVIRRPTIVTHTQVYCGPLNRLIQWRRHPSTILLLLSLEKLKYLLHPTFEWFRVFFVVVQSTMIEHHPRKRCAPNDISFGYELKSSTRDKGRLLSSVSSNSQPCILNGTKHVVVWTRSL